MDLDKSLVPPKFKKGDAVKRRWRDGTGKVLNVTIRQFPSAGDKPPMEAFIYLVEFPSCTSHFLESDLEEV